MLLFLSVFGIFLSLILLVYNARKYTSSVYLSLFFLFTSLYGLYQYILLYSKSVLLISLFLVNISVISSPVYLIGPMLYFYIRSVLTDRSRLKKSDLWHFMPMLIFFISALPNSFMSWEEKVEVAKAVVKDQGFIVNYKATLLNEIIPNVAIYVGRPVLVMIYAIWSMVLLIRYVINKRLSAVFSKQLFMKSWLFVLTGFLLVLVVSQILLIIKSFEMHFSDLFFTVNVVRIISVFGLIGLLISPFFFPAILYGLPRLPEKITSPPINGKIELQPAEEQSGKTNHFENEYLKSIEKKIDLCMKDVQPYLQSDFNLNHLSLHVQIPVHHLSYYFREERKQHFNEYRNEWRINHAKDLIRNGKANEYTLETIGLQSGFSSRNTFLNTFKKVEGIPPSAYLAQRKN